MKIRIEQDTTTKLPAKFEVYVRDALNSLPREHLHGIEKILIVDEISLPKLIRASSSPPGLYHPRQGSQNAWLEISANALLPPKPFSKYAVSRLSLRANLPAVVFSLVGQHHFLTFKHSVKRNKVEDAIQAYTKSRLAAFSKTKENRFSKLLKPLQPYLESASRKLNKKLKGSQVKAL